MKILSCCLGLFFLALSGCSGEPTLYPITGTITLDGQPYEQLLVYLRPIDQPITRSNMGVGATDKDGVLSFGSGAGDGIAAGKYRVSFSCFRTPSGEAAKGDQKIGDDQGTGVIEIVRPPYDYKTNSDSSPFEFEVKARKQNYIDFDIPNR